LPPTPEKGSSPGPSPSANGFQHEGEVATKSEQEDSSHALQLSDEELSQIPGGNLSSSVLYNRTVCCNLLNVATPSDLALDLLDLNLVILQVIW